MGGAVLTLSASTNRSVNHAREDLRAFYLAEAGLSEGTTIVAAAVAAGKNPPAALGTEAAPQNSERGRVLGHYRGRRCAGHLPHHRHVRSERARHALEAVAQKVSNSDLRPRPLRGEHLGRSRLFAAALGEGSQADDVEGDVYSGGDVDVEGDSTVNGMVRATGSITGASGDNGIIQPIPDLAGMDYASNNDVDVKAAFDAGGVYKSNALGGSAGELPKTIRHTSSGRTRAIARRDTSATTKDDYFLEDPYESVRVDSRIGLAATLARSRSRARTASRARTVQTSSTTSTATSGCTTATPSPSRWRTQPSESAVVTIVVKGNIYFSDNLFYEDDEKDGVVFIAMKDPSVPDSGNIYFGDPVFGTLEQMHAFMFAENDFYDVNLDAKGSAKVKVVGNMTAGNHVSIKRDYDTGSGIEHSQLVVDFDPRIVHKDVEPPGLPTTHGGESGLTMVSWREVAVR